MPPVIEPPNTHFLLAATGWLELGNHLEANAELHRLDPMLRSHPDVIEVRWQVYARALWWEACVDLATSLQRLAPDRPSGWLLKAASLRKTKGALVAWMSLAPASEKFPAEPAVPYQLACLCCQMGNETSALDWLGKAFARGDKDALKAQALKDPDLASLAGRIKSL